jgi:hypothetical protein
MWSLVNNRYANKHPTLEIKAQPGSKFGADSTPHFLISLMQSLSEKSADLHSWEVGESS